MRILITGGTGFVGSRLTSKLIEQGHTPVLLTRRPQEIKARFKEAQVYQWNANQDAVPAEAFHNIQGIINLMGENISNKRWSDSQKERLIKSRVDATNQLIQGVQKNGNESLEFFISASAIGYYPVNTGQNLDEASQKGQGFLSDLCQKWEESATHDKVAKRNVTMRIGVVLGREGGALAKLIPIFKLGAGGPVGRGRQIMSWIHVDDLVKAIIEFTQNEKYNGVYNLVSPHPVNNKDFSEALAKGLHRPCLFPVPPVALKIMMGEMASIVLDGQKVLPKRLLESGFQFRYPKIDGAMANL